MEDEYDVILSLGNCRCSKCGKHLAEGIGIMLKTCLHPFCRKCLTDSILESMESQIMCPHPISTDVVGLGGRQGRSLGCDSNGYLTRKEIEAVLSVEEISHYDAVLGHLNEVDKFTNVQTSLYVRPQTITVADPTPLSNFEKEFHDMNINGFHIVLNEIETDCNFCGEKLPVGSGINLQVCQHVFCRDCLQDAIKGTKSVRVNCIMGPRDCSGYILDREIKSIASEKVLEDYLQKCFEAAETQMNIFRCKTPDCRGMCEVDEKTRRVFLCPNCKQRNCIPCKAIHEDISCDKFVEMLAQGCTLAEASELAKQEMKKTGWDQLFSYLNVSGKNGSIVGASPSLSPTGIDLRNVSNYKDIRHKIQHSKLLPSMNKFACSICFEDIPPGEGILLQDCLHLFCRACIVNHITLGEDPTVKCPYVEGKYSCASFVAEREVKALLPNGIYEKYLQRSIKVAELVTQNSFHCLTPNCTGWCEAEESARFFWCPVCQKENCIQCKAFHEDMTCEQYKQKIEDDKNKQLQLQNEKAGEAAVMASIATQEFQLCPNCKSVCHKISGCNHVTCAACKTPFNWR